MQVILGGGGAIGTELAKALKTYNTTIRIVSRTPKKVNEEDAIFAADLTDETAVNKAVEGADVVYLVAGLPYKLKVWQTQWPQIVRNVIRACEQQKAKLVFFDNIYLYGQESIGHLTEDAPVDPPSKKGKVRAQIAQLIFEEVKAGRLTAMIVRAADFYGPGINTSVLQETVYKNFRKGKAAFWMGDRSKIHSFTYTPDAARATALLGNTPDAYNQVWHLPTSDEKFTGNDWIDLFAQMMKVKRKAVTVSKPMVRLMGLFNPLMKEMVEMMYQNNRDYFFDSTKFKKRFPHFKTTSYENGTKEILAAE
ncbi:NAD-dependent epimerase/dehydratase family protein [Flavisolibacter ginsenosidimutans]|uniref:NAD-dependent epimerase/dehydratase family protein n=1 Tax=Flavisolibacter ginsenosidimutans TaxID=661481 RepID=A0A5B8UHG7_9BACT|nr:NAD-dependent epimerase/dehydratase family protein [Flavisolibacter ginsenosidimutans]QEC55953.1 NAD-dependent epimerase/dehydratase family protein [Flavisolibacter ginsenosidimutans]